MSSMIRASYTKLALRHFKQHTPEEYEKIRASVGGATLAAIRDAGALAFLPAETHAKVAAATVSTFGAREARLAWRDVMLGAFNRAMLRPLVGSALRLYGRSPSSIMRMTPQGWSLVFRDCGKSWMDAVGTHRAVMRFEGLPRVIAESEGMIESFVANCDAALSYVGYFGKAAAARDELAVGRLSIDVTWQPSSPPDGPSK